MVRALWHVPTTGWANSSPERLLPTAQSCTVGNVAMSCLDLSGMEVSFVEPKGVISQLLLPTS